MAFTRVDIRINLPLADQVSGETAERGVRGATLEAKALTINELSQPGDGIAYKRGSKTHIASSPGKPPAPDTGRLRASTQSEVIRTPQGSLGIVSVNTEYAAALELGTERRPARPFLSTILRDRADRIRAAFIRFARRPDA